MPPQVGVGDQHRDEVRQLCGSESAGACCSRAAWADRETGERSTFGHSRPSGSRCGSRAWPAGFITTARRYRTITIHAGDRSITAADPIPAELRAALDAIHGTH
jgi:hypothetical protein